MKIYGNVLIAVDFNSEMTESAMENFCGTYHLHNFIKDPTCFKNPDKPLCIDLLLTNFSKSFLISQTLEIGLSDFHKLTLTVLKIYYKKQKPLVITYRDYKNFSNETFRIELLSAMERYSNISFADFHSEFLYLLGKHAPFKKRYIRANQKNFMDKKFNHAIMVKSKFRKKFLELKTEENRLAYAKQCNYCVKLLQQRKRQYSENLKLSSITDNELYWKTSPLFTEKNGSKNKKLTFAEGGKVLTDDAKIAATFNSLFGNIENILNIEKDESIFCDTGDATDLLLRAIKKYSKHPIILRIKQCSKKSD